MEDDVFVGRESAVAELRSGVDRAITGRGRMMLVTGEAGIGKTTVVAEAVRYAVGCGMQLRWATCWDGDGAPAYWPWVQVLRDHDGSNDPIASELVRIAPELAAPGGGSARVPRTLGDGGGDRFLLFDAVASMLQRTARARPLLVVVDDLQWADVPSLLLLDFLASRLPRMPLLLIGMFRDDEVGTDHPGQVVLANLRRTAELIVLAGLSEGHVARLMRSVAGDSPDTALSAAVSRRTGGNPFFVREVTQLLVSRGGLGDATGSGAGIPDGVRQVLQQRLARLPQECVSILTVAAVAGRELGLGPLARAAGCETGVVVERLTDAVRAGVLAPPRTAAGPYRFGHDLFRETLYDGLTPGTRADLHLSVAEALEQARTDPVSGHPAELAGHFLLAAVGHPELPALAGKAVRYSLAAATDAVGRLAYEDAVGHVRRALDGLDLAGILDDRARLELLLCRADALRRAGEPAGARDDYRQATRLARASAQAAQLARAALGVQALGVESGASRDECIALLEEALDRFDDADSARRAQVLAGLARELYLSRVDVRLRAAQLSSAAVDIARRVGDDATLAGCLLAAHDTIWLPGTAARRRAIATEMAAVARRAGDRAFEAEACLLRASAGLELADPTALADLDEFFRLGAAVGQPHYAYLVLTRQAMRAIMSGRLIDAERLLAEATTLADRTSEPDAWNVQTRLLWELRSAQGRRAEVEPQLRNSLPHLRYWWEALAGLAMLERGDRAGALRAIGPAVRPDRKSCPSRTW